MQTVREEPLADDALLRTYREGKHPELWDGYGDCFFLGVDRPVSLARFVAAFYTSPLFRVERLILSLALGAPASDDDVRQLAAGARDTFAVWQVSARTETQLLMSDRYGRTRSWFRVVPQASGGTLLKFGSAVAAKRGAQGTGRMGGGFNLLLGFHRLYSRMLLRSARRRLLTTLTAAREE